MWGFDVMNVKFLAHSRLSEQQAMLMNMWLSFLFPQKRGWLKMISFIRSFCNYRRFMSHPHKRQELEDYLHLEVHNKESKSLLYLFLFPVDILATRVNPGKKLQSLLLYVMLLQNHTWVHSLTCSTASLLTLSCGEERYSIFCEASNTEPSKEHGQLMLKRPELLLPFREGFLKARWGRGLQGTWSAHWYSSDWLVVR